VEKKENSQESISVFPHEGGEVWVVETKEPWVKLSDAIEGIHRMYKGVPMLDETREILESFRKTLANADTKVHVNSFMFGEMIELLQIVINVSKMAREALDKGFIEDALILLKLYGVLRNNLLYSIMSLVKVSERKKENDKDKNS